MWPGYETMTKCYTDGIFLNVDTATKFISQITVMDEVRDMLNKRYSKKEIEDHYSSSNESGTRHVVLTSFNSKAYQIDGITFS